VNTDFQCTFPKYLVCFIVKGQKSYGSVCNSKIYLKNFFTKSVVGSSVTMTMNNTEVKLVYSSNLRS